VTGVPARKLLLRGRTQASGPACSPQGV